MLNDSHDRRRSTINDCSDLKGEQWRKAVTYLQFVLDQLDGSDAPGDIGAHVDLAICRLEEAIVNLFQPNLQPSKSPN